MTANIDDARPKTLVSHHGARISYSVIGDGPNSLTLANDLGGRLCAWEPVVAALGDRYRIITWDYRGLFGSTPPEKISRMGVQVSLDAAHHPVMARRLPDAEAIHLRRASHFVLLERPEVAAPAMERFLAGRATW